MLAADGPARRDEKRAEEGGRLSRPRSRRGIDGERRWAARRPHQRLRYPSRRPCRRRLWRVRCTALAVALVPVLVVGVVVAVVVVVPVLVVPVLVVALVLVVQPPGSPGPPVQAHATPPPPASDATDASTATVLRWILI